MTDPKKPRPRRRRPKPESPLPADHPQRIVTDAVVEERLRAYEQRVKDAGLLRVTPPPVGVPCVDLPPIQPQPTGFRAYLADSFRRTASRLLRWATSLESRAS